MNAVDAVARLLDAPDIVVAHVGVAVLVYRDGRILLQHRSLRVRRMPGLWAPPGGLVEADEAFEAAARRELHEENGLTAGALVELAVTVNPTEEGSDAVTVWLIGPAGPEEAVVREPAKCDGVAWYTPGRLPAPLWPTYPEFACGGVWAIVAGIVNEAARA